MHEVHKEVIKSNVCGFDQWADNHYAFDGVGGDPSSPDIYQYVQKAESMGLPYRWMGKPKPPGISQPPGGPKCNIYVIDPTGFSVQYDGPSTHCPDNLPSYTAACKSQDGCAG